MNNLICNRDEVLAYQRGEQLRSSIAYVNIWN